MNLHVIGSGWVTPVGRDPTTVHAAIQSGTVPPVSNVTNPHTGRSHATFRVDPIHLADAVNERRLRRASIISHLALAAARDALAAANLPTPSPRTALLFAATNGGVIYTRRFFHDISNSGPHAGSPLLFPETVYNAPASHIAATLGITGITSTLVGDATVSLAAIDLAADLLVADQCDHVLILAAEESDWILCEAYALWALASPTGQLHPFSGDGTVFAEGAAALLLTSDRHAPSTCPSLTPHPGRTWHRPADLRAAHHSVMKSLLETTTPTRVIASANGSRFDAIEHSILHALLPGVPIQTPKRSLGESFTAASLAQVLCGIETHEPTLVSVIGATGQTSALTVNPARRP